MFGLIFVFALVTGVLGIIRLMGFFGILWLYVPFNMYAFITTMRNKSIDLTLGGGGITNILHNVPGKRIDKSSTDHMKWEFCLGEEKRGLLYHLIGVQWMGFYRSAMLVNVRTFRWGRKEDEGEYHMLTKDQKTSFVFFSGQHDIEIKDAETVGQFRLDFVFNLNYENTFPVKEQFKLADSNAVLSIMAEEKVIGITGTKEPEDFLGGSEENKRKLTESILGISERTLLELGKGLTEVNLASVEMDEKERVLFELKETKRREGEAALITAELAAKQTIETAKGTKAAAILVAEGAKQAKELTNLADEDYVTRVLKPMATDERAVAVFRAAAYRDNGHVTTYAPGEGDAILPLNNRS